MLTNYVPKEGKEFKKRRGLAWLAAKKNVAYNCLAVNDFEPALKG